MDAECPSETQALDNGIECNADDRSACTTSSEHDAVSQATPAKEVLCRSYGNGLVRLSVLEDHLIVKACDIP